jgi:beta-glucanase (GH16 family)
MPVRRVLLRVAALTIALGLTAAIAPVARAAGIPAPAASPGPEAPAPEGTPAPAGAPSTPAEPGTPGEPRLVAVVFDTDVVLVGGRGFPPSAQVSVKAETDDLSGTATVTSTAQGRLLLGFRVPEGFSGTVTLTARSGSAEATTSLSVTIPSGSTNIPTPQPPATPAPPGPAQPAGPGPAIPGNWKLAFGDEFDGAALDLTKWQMCNPSFRASCLPWNNEKQIFRTSAQNNPNVVVKDGQLHLVATKDGGQIYSGMVSTGPWPATFGPKPADYKGFSYTYGYYEGRVRIPKGNGFWPSLWALPWQQQQGGVGWPDTGEYDNFEIPGNNPSEYHFTAHWGGGFGECGHPCTPQTASISDASANWHTYGFDWSPDGLTWYVDGQKMGKTVTDPAAIKKHPFYIIANFSVGGDWGPLKGGVDAGTPFPASMDIDYLRVYQRG